MREGDTVRAEGRVWRVTAVFPSSGYVWLIPLRKDGQPDRRVVIPVQKRLTDCAEKEAE